MVTLAYLAGLTVTVFIVAAAADMPYNRSEWQRVADDWRWRIAVRAERLADLRAARRRRVRVTPVEYACLGLCCAAQQLHYRAWRLLQARLSRTNRRNERNRA